jgi:hypothetical protein
MCAGTTSCAIDQRGARAPDRAGVPRPTKVHYLRARGASRPRECPSLLGPVHLFPLL